MRSERVSNGSLEAHNVTRGKDPSRLPALLYSYGAGIGNWDVVLPRPKLRYALGKSAAAKDRLAAD